MSDANHQLRSIPLTSRTGAHSSNGSYSFQHDRYVKQSYESVILGNSGEHKEKLHIVGVADGHGDVENGHVVSSYISEELCNFLIKHDCLPPVESKKLHDMVLSLDKAAISRCNELPNCHSGSTLVFAIHNETRKNVHIVHAGDSRCYIIRRDASIRFVTSDHEPTDERERKRVYSAGGFVHKGRVMGYIAMSRAIGDDDLKGKRNETMFKIQGRRPYTDQLFIADPDVSCFGVQDDDIALLLVSDGVSNHLAESTITSIISKSWRKRMSGQDTATLLIRRAKGAKDNSTAVVHWLQKRGHIHQRQQRTQASRHSTDGPRGRFSLRLFSDTSEDYSDRPSFGNELSTILRRMKRRFV